MLIRHLWQLKTVVFLHWCLIRAVQLGSVLLLKTKYEKTVVAQNKSNLFLKNQMYNMSTLQLIQLKCFNEYLIKMEIVYNRIKGPF